MRNWIVFTVMAVSSFGVAWLGCSSGGGTGTSGSTKGAGGATATASHASTGKAMSSTTTMVTSTSVSTGTAGGGGGAGGAPPVMIMCNPVTNAPCMNGDACDVAFDMSGNFVGFMCYTGMNTAAICGACNANGGPFCAAGGTCLPIDTMNNECYRYCCTDADCGPGNSCNTQNMMFFAPAAPSLGLCVTGGGDGGVPEGGSPEAGAPPDAGPDAAAGDGGPTVLLPACDAPAMAPSMGMCVTVM